MAGLPRLCVHGCAVPCMLYCSRTPPAWHSHGGTRRPGKVEHSHPQSAGVLDKVEMGMKEIVTDPSRILAEDFDMFKSVADEVSEFREWREEMLSKKVTAADGSRCTQHAVMREVLAYARRAALLQTRATTRPLAYHWHHAHPRKGDGAARSG